MRVYATIGIVVAVVLLVWNFGYAYPNQFSDDFILHTSFNVGTIRTTDDIKTPLGDPQPIRFVWTKYIEDSQDSIIDIVTTYRYSNLESGDVLWEMSFEESFDRYTKKYVDKEGYFLFPQNLEKKSYFVYDVGGSVLKHDFVKEHQVDGLTIYEFYGNTVFEVTELYPDYGTPVFEEYSARTFVEKQSGIELKFEESFTDYVILDEKKMVLLDAQTVTDEQHLESTMQLITEYVDFQYFSFFIFPSIIIASGIFFAGGYYIKNRLFGKRLEGWKVFLPSIVVALLLVFIYAEPSEPVVIGLSDWPGYYTLFIAMEKGLFEKNGVDVILDFTENYDDAVEKYKTVSVDGVMVVTSDVIDHNRSSIYSEVVWISDISLEGDAIIVKDKSSVEKLKKADCDKLLADCEYIVGVTSFNSFSNLLILDYLESIGVSEDNVLIKKVKNTETARAIESGEILLGHTWSPFVEESLDLGHQIVYTPSMSTYSIVDGLVFDHIFVQENPTKIRNIVKALNQALDFFEENPQEAMQIISKYSEIPVEELEMIYQSMEIPNSKTQIQSLEKASNAIVRASELHYQTNLELDSSDGKLFEKRDLVNYSFGGYK